MAKKVCPYCGYEWEPRVEEPKYCPMCKRPLNKVSSRKQLVKPKETPQTEHKLIRCSTDGCEELAMFETPDRRPLCRNCYIEHLNTVRQLKEEDVFDH